MNLFKEIERLSGENLTTAILRMLLLRSQEIRESLIRLISKISPFGPLTLGSDFSCHLEYETEDKQSGHRGRIDLIIETEDAVIGIENKLHSPFQGGQPLKYLDVIKEHANTLSKLRKTEFKYFLVVLAPQSRSDEIEKLIENNRHCLCLLWQNIVSNFSEVKTQLDQMSQIILINFIDYIEEKITFIPNFTELVPHLKQDFVPYGTSWQYEVVKALWGFFPDSGPRLSNGETWIGYYFCASTNEYSGWYGFINPKRIKSEAKNGSELIIVTSFPVRLKSKYFRSIILDSPNWLGTTYQIIYAWAIDFDKEWKKPEKWMEELKLFNEAIEQLEER